MIDVSALCAFTATAQEQDDRFSGLSVVHPIAGTNIDLEFPHTPPTKLVIAEIVVHEPIDATEDCGLSARIPQRSKPLAERILVLGSDVLENLHVILAYKRMIVKG